MLSSSEVKWVALSEVVNKVLLVIQVLRSKKKSVQLPIIERVDNVGAIFITSNIITISHNKHFDIRYQYVNEFVGDGIVKIIFVKST